VVGHYLVPVVSKDFYFAGLYDELVGEVNGLVVEEFGADAVCHLNIIAGYK